jgi:hypothetical protein
MLRRGMRITVRGMRDERDRRVHEVPSGDSGCIGFLLGVAVCAIILGLFMWAGWIFRSLDRTVDRIAFVGLLGFVAGAAAYVARSVSR